MKSPENEIYYSQSLISLYSAFRDEIFNPKSVLYPSCGFDGSPVKVFDKVTFVDLENGNEGCVIGLQKE